jgi:hypothetical protein
MRKRITIFIICLFLALPSVSHSWSRGRYYGYGGCYNGWAVGATIAGSILIGAVVGNMIAQSAYNYPPPQRVYYAPPQSNVAYAYPDPDFVARYSQNKPSDEWAIVPGQSVNGKWVPEHRVRVPINQ